MKAAKGYNAGGAGLAFNSMQFTGFGPYEFEQESIWNYEFYTRHRFSHSVEVLTNLCYNDYDCMQMTQTTSSGDVFIANLDEASFYGAEIGSRWYATSSLELLPTWGF